MLIGFELRQTLHEEGLGLGQVAAKSHHLRVVDDRIGREHLVELVPVLAIDRVAIGDHEILNLLAVRQILQGHGHCWTLMAASAWRPRHRPGQDANLAHGGRLPKDRHLVLA